MIFKVDFYASIDEKLANTTIIFILKIFKNMTSLRGQTPILANGKAF